MTRFQTDLELAHEGVDSDDGEDQPEDDTDHQHVEDAGDGLDESINNDLGIYVRFCCKVIKF